MNNRMRFAAILLAWCWGMGTAWALSSDRDEPIYIEADSVKIDESRGVSTYVGGVRITQGSTRIDADEVVVHTEDRRLANVIATGAPAVYRQRVEENGKEVEAQALRIEYGAQTGMLLLTGEAELHQSGNRFSGERIEYDTHQDIVRATGAEEKQGRVRVIIQPELLPGSAKNDDGK